MCTDQAGLPKFEVTVPGNPPVYGVKPYPMECERRVVLLICAELQDGSRKGLAITQ